MGGGCLAGDGRRLTANVHFTGNGKMSDLHGNSVVGSGAVSCYMHGGFDVSGFAAVIPTLVMFQLCGDRFKSLTVLKFSKTLLVDLQKSAVCICKPCKV